MQGKRAIISGASAGIGRETARRLAASGASLILLARREERLRELAIELERDHNIEVVCLPVDMGDREAFHNLLQEKTALLQQADILVNNAGAGMEWGPLEDMSAAGIDRMLEVNLHSHLQLCRTVIPGMRQRGSGDLLFLGSVSGRWGCRSSAVYCAAKFALRGIVESLRLDLKGTQVRVMLLEPGMTRTEFSDPKLYQGYQPLEAGDIAETVEWCLSRPAHMNVQEMVIYCTAQAATNIMHIAARDE